MMTKENYLQILADSELFKKLDEKTKAEIFKAEGQTMEKYSQIFLQINTFAQNENEEFLKNVKNIYSNFIKQIKPLKKKTQVLIENASKAIENNTTDMLLISLENEK